MNQNHGVGLGPKPTISSQIYSVQSVAKKVSAGTLKPVRLGRRVLIRVSDVRSVIETRTPQVTR